MVVGILKTLSRGVLEIIAPLIKMIVAEVIKSLLVEFNKVNPQDTLLVCTSLYPIIDTKLEPLVEKTDTELDDAAVKGMMKGMEEFAEEVGIVLPNLDDD